MTDSVSVSYRCYHILTIYYRIFTAYLPHIYHIFTTYLPHVYHIFTTYLPHIYHIDYHLSTFHLLSLTLQHVPQSKKMVVFYGSQTGTAEEFATRLCKEARYYGISAMSADPVEYDVVSQIL